MIVELLVKCWGMKYMYSRVVRIEVSSHELVDSGFGWDLSTELYVCDRAMGAEKESGPVNCGAWLRLSDPLVVLLKVFLVLRKIILDFGNLRRD